MGRPTVQQSSKVEYFAEATLGLVIYGRSTSKFDTPFKEPSIREAIDRVELKSRLEVVWALDVR